MTMVLRACRHFSFNFYFITSLLISTDIAVNKFVDLADSSLFIYSNNITNFDYLNNLRAVCND